MRTRETGQREMGQALADVIDVESYPLECGKLRARCKRRLDETGVLVMRNFLKPAAVASLQREGEENRHLAYYTVNSHNIYLSPADPDYPPDHSRNRQVSSSKGCIAADHIPAGSALRRLYGAPAFRAFLCAVLDEAELHDYADSLSSITLNYASAGQELGWHFDNSSFAITLMVQAAEHGGVFEYVKDVRDADSGDMNYALCRRILDGEVPTKTLSMDAGTLVLFRGRNSMHRVTPVEGGRTRMLAVLAYNTRPGISLSDSARLTFYGRLA